MIKVYIAGKLNDDAVGYIKNMHRMINTAKSVRKLGCCVYVPCLDILEGLVDGEWALVNFPSLEPLVKVLEYGCIKYEPYNWMKGLDKTEILESMARHLFALISGEKVDKESRLEHIGHIMCNAMFYSYFDKKENEK